MTLPDQLGRYRILALLGSGAMGDVFLAQDPHIERRLAIKTVRLEGADRQELAARRARLLMEAKAAGQLVHPNVVTLFDAGEDDGVVYLAFEYVEGTDLGRRLGEEPPLSLRQVLEIVGQTARALGHAHESGIVHRDVKPGNILLTQEGLAKIGDFGIAKMRDRVSDLTSTGTIIGTPYYMSPEQVRGEALDGRSDIFSLGCVFYEVLHRARPFTGNTITTLVYQILHHDPVLAETIRRDLPPAVIELLTRSLAKDLEARFATAGELDAAVTTAFERITPQRLDAPAYDSLDSGATRVNTPISVSPGLPMPVGSSEAASPPPANPDPKNPILAGASAPQTAPPILPPLPPPVVEPLSPSVDGGAPRTPVDTGAQSQSAQSQSAQSQAKPTNRRAWRLFAVGCLGLVAVGSVVIWFALRGLGQARERLLGEAGSAIEQGPLPVPGGAAELGLEDSELSREQVPNDDLSEAQADDSGGPIDDQDEIEVTPLEVVAATPKDTIERETPSSSSLSSSNREGRATENGATPGASRSSPAPGAVTESRRASPSEPRAPDSAKPPDVEVSDSGGSPRAADAPSSEIPFDLEVDTSTALRFRVRPDDAYVALKAESDERFVQIGRAEEFDPGKRRARAFDLPGEGVFYLLFRREGLQDQTVRVHARRSRGGGPTVVAVDMRRGAATTFGSQVSGREGITFRGGPPRARILVDGREVGRLREFSGGQMLPLDPGTHELVVVDPRGQRRTYDVEIAATADQRLAVILVPIS